jgi:hypothetical protein
MKVVWNSYSGAVPLDVSDNRDDFIAEVYSPSDSLLEVHRTVINNADEVLIEVSAAAHEGEVKPLSVAGYTISVLAYENDAVRHAAPIIKHEIHGKTLRIWVNACLP